MSPTLTDRPFRWLEDVQPITQFLLDSYRWYGRLFNWEPRRWQSTVYHNNDADMTRMCAELPKRVHLWEDGGQIVGVVIIEPPASVFLQIHPTHRHLEAAMLDWAEAHLPPSIEVWAETDDSPRTTLLEARGYVQTEAHEITRRRPMHEPIAESALPQGYRLRTMRQHPDDQQGIADLLNTAFNRTIHSAEEYRNFQTSPYYRADLDLVIEAADGKLVTNTGVTAFANESFAVFEPVCTHPDHQGKGLARAAIAEGLRRVDALGIEAAFIGAWYENPVSNHLYAQMGFTDAVCLYLWRRP